MPLSKLFFQKPILHIGVDIGSGALKIVLLHILRAEMRLISAKCEDLSRFKEDEEKDSFILQQVDDFIKAHGAFNRTVHLNLSVTNAVFTKTVKLPFMPQREIPNAAKWQIKDELPVNIAETEFGWQYASAPSKTFGRRIEIICAAAKKDFINKYVELFKSANISLYEITFSPFSVNAVLFAEDAFTPVLDIGHKQSVFSMHAKGRILFIRAIHVGADNFTAPQQNQHELSIGHLSDELVRSIKYCELEFTKQPINRVYLTGGGAKIEALQTELKSASGLDVKILRFPRNIQVDEDVRKDFEKNRTSMQLLSAIGAVVSSDAKIDLLPMEARTEKILQAERISFRLIGITVMLLLILSSFAVRLQVNIVKKRLDNAEAELAFLKEAQVIKNEIIEYDNAVNTVEEGHIPPEWVLKFISSVMPENMELNSFVFNSKDRYANLRGIVNIRGSSAEGVITEFIRNLKQLELFKDAKLVSIERASGDYSSFNIICNLIE